MPTLTPRWSEDQVLELVQLCSNRGRWGAEDELGTLNYISPQKCLQGPALQA
ncbi:MAG: hypothetical protein JOZ39_03075 [Chloroflexi bacterium]|nr:hypothetical protein [Chloroflexota bacterium]